jgi:(S)-ureidoglycine aminohydrolase
MNIPGHTRSSRQLTHLLQTPDTFVRTAMPGLVGGMAIIHAAPELGAKFLQYTVELKPGGSLAGAHHQRFIYVIYGEATITLEDENYAEGSPQTHTLRPGSFVCMPSAVLATLTAYSTLRLVVIEKRYVPIHGVHPHPPLFGHEDEILPEALNEDPDICVRSLLPSTFEFDFAVNTMTYAHGAALPQVEIHVMEHGCLMLEGHGTYLLGDKRYPVQAGDFIWMAPFCPQWFQAEGPLPAKYLIYKDWNRVPPL